MKSNLSLSISKYMMSLPVIDYETISEFISRRNKRQGITSSINKNCMKLNISPINIITSARSFQRKCKATQSSNVEGQQAIEKRKEKNCSSQKWFVPTYDNIVK